MVFGLQGQRTSILYIIMITNYRKAYNTKQQNQVQQRSQYANREKLQLFLNKEIKTKYTVFI